MQVNIKPASSTLHPRYLLLLHSQPDSGEVPWSKKLPSGLWEVRSSQMIVAFPIKFPAVLPPESFIYESLEFQLMASKFMPVLSICKIAWSISPLECLFFLFCKK